MVISLEINDYFQMSRSGSCFFRARTYLLLCIFMFSIKVSGMYAFVKFEGVVSRSMVLPQWLFPFSIKIVSVGKNFFEQTSIIGLNGLSSGKPTLIKLASDIFLLACSFKLDIVNVYLIFLLGVSVKWVKKRQRRKAYRLCMTRSQL